MVGCNRQLDTMEYPKDVRADEGLSRLGWPVAVSGRGLLVGVAEVGRAPEYGLTLMVGPGLDGKATESSECMRALTLALLSATSPSWWRTPLISLSTPEAEGQLSGSWRPAWFMHLQVRL